MCGTLSPQETTRQFYQCVMGGGGHDIHFGIYKEPTDGVKESSEYTTQWWGAVQLGTQL